MLLLVQYTLIFASVLMLVALGGCFSEHSGVINLGLEGIMVMGALGGALAMKYMGADASAPAIIFGTTLAAIACGVVFSLLLAFACVNFNADQTLVGTAMNLLATAFATIIARAINTAEDPNNVSNTIQYIQQKKALIVNINGFEFSWFMLFALVAFIVSEHKQEKPPVGRPLIACRENPQAAPSLGRKV
ncbi:MAG: ABC transporter permease, partial [Erysipelotrichaceae bacterium]|nr:ABC transporter permease [Erysipelotrichaceae bacterium]